MLLKVKPYIINILYLTVILVGLAWLFDFTPFGKETMLTVDLGQQYIDFYSLYRETLFNQPEMLLYSFQKAIGGEMVGLWAYYLMSPFNLIFLLFEEHQLAVAVTIITYLKIVAASLSFMYFARKKYQVNTTTSLIFSLSYALMSYVMVYLLNIMWLDGLVFLPLIALGLDKLVTLEKPYLYVVSLSLMLIANYYIGYMISLFLALYALFVIFEHYDFSQWKKAAIQYGRFILYSIIAVLISGISLIPTFVSLSSSKAEHMNFEFNLDVAHELNDIGSKLFIGSFNFDEMSSGSPNLYAGMLVLLLFVLYFTNRKIKWSEKLIAIIITTVFLFTYHYRVLDRIWHGGQFPIWYHFRFSFTHTFLIIVLALKAFKYQPKRYSAFTLISLMLGFAAYTFYYYFFTEYEFLDEMRLFVSLAFFLVLLLILQMEQLQPALRQIVLLAIVSCELFINGVLILNEMSYVDVSKFNDYTATLNEAVADLRHDNNDFYRINKTYMRTKDEAMFAHYNGLDHFGSTLDAVLPDLYGYLGLPEGNGFVTYTNGTLFTDDFFNIRYLIDVTDDSADHTATEEYVLFPQATDLDIQAHPVVQESDRYLVHENTSRLGLGMEVSSDIASEDISFIRHQPIRNQETLLSLIDFNGNDTPYFTSVPIEITNLDNVTITDEGDGDYFTYTPIDSDADATVEMQFSTTSNNPYYFSIPSQFDDENVALELNGERYRFYAPFRRRQLTNASYQTIQNNQTFTYRLLESELQANMVNLYEFDEERYNQMIASKQDNQLKVTEFSQNRIKGTINIQQEKAHVLFTIPYDQNWQITVDNEKVEPMSVLSGTLLAIPITQGNHNIELHYFPNSIWVGLAATIFGLAGVLAVSYVESKNKEKLAQLLNRIEVERPSIDENIEDPS
ncbi:YfhO family protein [Fundicoccus culcitae]|uniref:YfhO family protein n=1 Tax=Fundicoccus culcitae TaxID=2969821 RepID=A0ABY5P772_9LACT|nr:YfhO family protein [Fundicoccus culcitae]UUX34586.1 YfhO family protein [Fundicoccus culcitae]